MDMKVINFSEEYTKALKSYASTFSERRWDGAGTYQNFFPHPCISDVQNDTLKQMHIKLTCEDL